jgi:hypothetical protein
VTNKTGFGFDDRIYWTFTQVVTTVHKSPSDTLSSSSTGHFRLPPHFTTSLLRCTLSRRLAVSSYNSTARTPRKTPSFVVKSAYLLVHYLAVEVLLLSACVTETCLPTRSLAMGLHVTIYKYTQSVRSHRKQQGIQNIKEVKVKVKLSL